MRPTILCEVFETPEGIITVTSDYGGGGTRLCGIKLVGSGSKKIAEFRLDRSAIDALSEEMAILEQARGE